MANWKLIVEEEQKGGKRADYGEMLIKDISEKLTKVYGEGFKVRNIWYMRKFYLNFKKLHSLRAELTWTHYRLLLKVEKEEVKNYYIEECIKQNWATRQLERQINSFYYERILSSKNKNLIRNDAKKTEANSVHEDITKQSFRKNWKLLF